MLIKAKCPHNFPHNHWRNASTPGNCRKITANCDKENLCKAQPRYKAKPFTEWKWNLLSFEEKFKYFETFSKNTEKYWAHWYWDGLLFIKLHKTHKTFNFPFLASTLKYIKYFLLLSFLIFSFSRQLARPFCMKFKSIFLLFEIFLWLELSLVSTTCAKSINCSEIEFIGIDLNTKCVDWQAFPGIAHE